MSYQDTCERLRDTQQMLRWSILAEDQEEILDDTTEDDYTDVTEIN